MRFRFAFLLLISLSPTLCWAQSYCARKSGTELKEQPKARAATSWRVGKFMPLQGTGKSKNGFVEVIDLDGDAHWARRKDLSTRLRCAVISVRNAKLRKGPGKDFPISEIDGVDKYSAFKDLGGEDGWIQVQDETGAKAWVLLDHVWKAVDRRLRMSFENSEN